MGRSCPIRRGFPNRSACQGCLRRRSHRVRRAQNRLSAAKNRVSTGTKSITASTITLVVVGMEMRASRQETAIPQTVSGMAARTGGGSSARHHSDAKRPARRHALQARPHADAVMEQNDRRFARKEDVARDLA